MRQRHSTPMMLACLVVLGSGSTLWAQAASSKNYFMTSVEFADGAVSSSTNYRLRPALGTGVVPARTASANYVVVGGHSATQDVKITGRPWLVGALPLFATPKSGAALSLWGTELNLGPVPTVKVGGQTATIGSRTQQLITTTLPSQPVPGWQPIEVSNGFGTTVLPRGIGILPLMFTEPAPASNQAVDVMFKGTQGDLVVWAVSAFVQAPVKLPGFLHGLALNPGAMLILPGFSITSPSGEFRFPIPAAPYSSPIYVQALFGTSNPGYAPGAFSNVLIF